MSIPPLIWNWQEKLVTLNSAMKMIHPNGVIIIHPGTLGDVLLALKAIRSIRDRLPGHECILLARGEIGRLLMEYGVIDRVIALEGPVFSELLEEYPRRKPEITDIFSRCTHAVAWVHDSGGRLSENLQRVGISHRCVVSPHAHSLQALHQSDRFCETLELGMSDTSGKAFLPPGRPQADEPLLKISIPSFQTKQSKPVIMIHPGSGSRHKCLSPERLSLIIKRLAGGDDRTVLICQGPADEERVTALKPYLDQVSYKILKDVDLSEMARVLRQTDVFLGHDSGITHLAAALGVPTVALFGPTDPQRWSPKGDHVEVIHGPSCQCQDWQAVQHCSEKLCLTHSVDEVVEAVERGLRGAGMEKPQRQLVKIN